MFAHGDVKNSGHWNKNGKGKGKWKVRRTRVMESLQMFTTTAMLIMIRLNNPIKERMTLSKTKNGGYTKFDKSMVHWYNGEK